MGAFLKKYSITVNKDYITTLNIFRAELDDMSRKGYSLGGNTVIHNSDHKGRFFSGEYKNNCFVVRQTDSAGDDFYYNLLPKHFVSFEAADGGTKVNVRSSNKYLLMIFLLFFVIAIILFSLLLMIDLSEGRSLTNLLYTLIPSAVCSAACVFSSKQLDDTKSTLMYIYKRKH